MLSMLSRAPCANVDAVSPRTLPARGISATWSVAGTTVGGNARRSRSQARSTSTSQLRSTISRSLSVRGMTTSKRTSASRTERSGAAATAAATAGSGAASTSAASSNARAATDVYFERDTRPVILFDGVCNLCNGAVNFMLDWDTGGAFRLAALQSRAGRELLARCGRSPDDISSIVLVERDACYIRSEAVLRIGYKISMPFPALAALGFPFPLLIRDSVYDLVANNRYLIFGRTATCRLSDDRFADRFLSDA